MKPRRAARDVDEYIAGFPDDVQERLKRIRATIRKAAPAAREAITYQIPTFVLDGSLIFFAAFKNHISVYPAPRGNPKFKTELSRYKGGKGTVQFPMDKPIPYGLITRLTKFRMREMSQRRRARRK